MLRRSALETCSMLSRSFAELLQASWEDTTGEEPIAGGSPSRGGVSHRSAACQTAEDTWAGLFLHFFARLFGEGILMTTPPLLLRRSGQGFLAADAGGYLSISLFCLLACLC